MNNVEINVKYIFIPVISRYYVFKEIFVLYNKKYLVKGSLL